MDESLTGNDIMDGTLTGDDVQDGSLTGDDIQGALDVACGEHALQLVELVRFLLAELAFEGFRVGQWSCAAI